MKEPGCAVLLAPIVLIPAWIIFRGGSWDHLQIFVIGLWIGCLVTECYQREVRNKEDFERETARRNAEENKATGSVGS
jgi:hypothetical protein